MHPGVDFRFSAGWFDCFKAQNDILQQRATNVAQQNLLIMKKRSAIFAWKFDGLLHQPM